MSCQRIHRCYVMALQGLHEDKAVHEGFSNKIHEASRKELKRSPYELRCEVLVQSFGLRSSMALGLVRV